MVFQEYNIGIIVTTVVLQRYNFSRIACAEPLRIKKNRRRDEFFDANLDHRKRELSFTFAKEEIRVMH